MGLLGGRASEEMTFDSVTNGASNDLQRATQIARTMITRFGMSNELGLRTFGDPQGEIFLGRELVERRDYSEEAAAAIDVEVGKLLESGYKRAQAILKEHKAKLSALAEALMEHETIDRDQFEALMGVVAPAS